MMPREIAESLRAELDEHLQAIRKIADMIESWDRVTVPDLPPVPYRSQWDADAQRVKSDCGPACVAMLLEYHGVKITIDDISALCGLGSDKKYTTSTDLASASKKCGLVLDTVTGWTLEQFAARCPCIVLVHYGTFADRLDQNYTSGHWVVLLGVYDNQAIYHDPDWWPPRRDEGASRRADIVRFALAMHDCVRDGNPAGLGLVIH